MNCEICESTGFVEKNYLTERYLQCSNCLTIFADKLSQEKVQSIDPQSFIENFKGYQLSRFSWLKKLLLKLNIKNAGPVLDIGSFDGEYISFFNYLGFNAFGIEPQHEMVNFCQNEGLQVYRGSIPNDIPKYIKNNRFKLITSFESVYYWSDLHKCAQFLYDHLEIGGFLIIKFHQGTSNYHNNTPMYSSRVANFTSLVNRKSLELLFNQYNFKLKTCQLFSPTWHELNKPTEERSKGLKKLIAKLRNLWVSYFSSDLKWDKIVLVFQKI